MAHTRVDAGYTNKLSYFAALALHVNNQSFLMDFCNDTEFHVSSRHFYLTPSNQLNKLFALCCESMIIYNDFVPFVLSRITVFFCVCFRLLQRVVVFVVAYAKNTAFFDDTLFRVCGFLGDFFFHSTLFIQTLGVVFFYRSW